MKKFVSLIASAYLGSAQTDDDVIRSVYEHARHGARSPKDNTGFDVGPDTLTDQGMRQRRLLGKWNWQRYDAYGLFGQPRDQAKYNAYEVAAQSTDYTRTVQSASSEMTGMYPPNKEDCYNCKLSGPEQDNLAA